MPPEGLDGIESHVTSRPMPFEDTWYVEAFLVADPEISHSWTKGWDAWFHAGRAPAAVSEHPQMKTEGLSAQARVRRPEKLGL